MKQLIFALPILFFSVFSDSRMLSAQVKLVQIEPSAQKFKIPVAKRVINGKYYMEYETLSNLIDSLGLNIGADSIYMAADTIKLRDGSGYVVLKDTSNTNELAKYQEGTSFVGVPKQGDLWYDNKVTSGIPNNRIYIYNNGSWQLLKHRDLYRQIGFDDAYTNECHEIIEFNQPLQGVPPLRHITKTNGPIKMSSSTDYGLAEHVTTTTISIDTADLVNIILDSILTPTPSADSTSVLAGYGITVTETPSNTFTIKADTSKLATQYDLTLKENALTFSSPLNRSGNTISIQNASGSQAGALSAADWTTFNNKVGGSGSSGRVTFWNGANTVSSDANFLWDNTRMVFHPTTDVINIGRFTGSTSQGANNINIGLYNGNGFGGSNANNVSIGNQNYWNSSTGINNVVIGMSNYINSTGSYNVVIGDGNNSNGSGSNNLYIGRLVGVTAGSHYENVGLGYNVLSKATSAFRNVANGSYSLSSLTTGSENLGLGFYAGGAITTHSGCVGVGSYAIGIANGGNNNTALGTYAASNNTGNEIVAIGSSSARYQGQRTVAIGAGAGGGVSAVGNSNIFLGWSAGNGETGSNRLHITNSNTTANGIYGDFANSRFGVNQAPSAMTNTFDINGTLRVRTTTGTATNVMGRDANGVLVSLGLTNLSVTGGNLVGPTIPETWTNISNHVVSWGSTGTFGSGYPIAVGVTSATQDVDINGHIRLRGAIYDSGNSAGSSGQVLTSQGAGAWTWTTLPIGSGGATQYLNPYLINSDTVGFYLTVAQDTVVFHGTATTGEATTVGDTPTIDMTLTGTTITASVVDGSITPAKLSQTYLTSEVDGSVSNELQTLSINNNQLSITGGNTVTLPSGGSTEWASLDYGTQAANTQSFTSSVWNTINFLGSNESNSAIINANHTNDDIEFVVAGNYKIDYAVSFVANADALIYMGLHSSVTNDVPFKTQIEGDTDVGYKTCQMSKSIIYSATAGEKLKLQIQPLTAHTSVGVYAHFIITKL